MKRITVKDQWYTPSVGEPWDTWEKYNTETCAYFVSIKRDTNNIITHIYGTFITGELRAALFTDAVHIRFLDEDDFSYRAWAHLARLFAGLDDLYSRICIPNSHRITR
jgi:hypothetical protein